MPSFIVSKLKATLGASFLRLRGGINSSKNQIATSAINIADYSVAHYRTDLLPNDSKALSFPFFAKGLNIANLEGSAKYSMHYRVNPNGQ